MASNIITRAARIAALNTVLSELDEVSNEKQMLKFLDTYKFFLLGYDEPELRDAFINKLQEFDFQ